MSVILVSVLGPPKYICGTHSVYNPSVGWWRMTKPDQYPGYICNRIKHLTGDIFVAITHTEAYGGNVMVTEDQGHTWKYQPSPGDQPVNLARGAGFVWLTSGDGIYRSNNGYDWTFLNGSPGSIQNLVVFEDGKLMGHKGDRLYKSANLGASWQEVYSPARGSPYPWFDSTVTTGTPSFAIAGKSSGHIIASMGASLWETFNFGNSWTKIKTWSTWYIPRELHYVRGNNWVLKMRKLEPGSPQINVISTSFDNCRNFTDRFNQDITTEHQIEYIRPLGLLLCGHTRYITPKPWETWLARYVPALMASWDGGMSFYEIVSDVFGQTFSIVAIAGALTEPTEYNMDVLLKKRATKTYSEGITLKSIPSKQYTADLLCEKTLAKQYPSDLLIKGIGQISYNEKVLIQKTRLQEYDLKTDVAVRKTKTYTMNQRTIGVHHMPYSMQALKLKYDVKKNYNMDIIIVNNYEGPIKRDIINEIPQPFELEIENVNYVLRKEYKIENNVERY